MTHGFRRTSFVTTLIASALFATSLFGADEVPPIRFPTSPRLAITVDELARLKASPEFPARRDAAVKQAEGLLAQPVPVPDGPGDWVFYYACPDDGATLQAIDLKQHRCPQCQKTYSDERTVASYRNLLHDRANDAALALGWAFAFTGDDRFAREVQRILTKLADDYGSYPKRRDRWGRTGWFAPLGGRRYSQSLDEAVGVIRLAKAYDLVRSAAVWSDGQREHVEKDLFRATADTLLWSNRDINNHQTWYNAGLICIASALGDEPLVRRVLTMKGGYHDQLRRSVGRDGLWYEGAMAYHNYALQAMIEIVDAGHRLGLPLHEEPQFKALILAPLRYAYPNGQFPAINDSDYGHLNSFHSHFLWAWKKYSEPRFAHAYADGHADRLRSLLGPDARPEPAIETRSEDLPDAGLVVLRRGAGREQAVVMLDYGPHGGGHGHYDKLSLVLFANGREWLLDPGRLTYSHKEYKTWVKHTVAHNTVTLGGQTQNETTGKLLWLDVQDRFAACAAQSDGAYDGAVLTRYLLLTDRLLLDVFRVRAAEPTTIDWLAHAVADSVRPVGDRGPPTGESPGSAAGYQHLTEGQRWDVSGASAWDFAAGKQSLRVWFAGPDSERLFTCHGIGYWIGTKTPTLVRRRSGRETTFVTAYDLSGDAGHVAGLETQSDGEAVRVTAKTSDGDWQVRFAPGGVQCRASK